MLGKCVVRAVVRLECQAGMTWRKYGQTQGQIEGGEFMFLTAISKTVPAATIVIKIIIVIKNAVK